jgi:hypothetical protein
MFRLLPFLLIVSAFPSLAQVNELQGTFALGDSEGTVSMLYNHQWELGNNKKFAVGLGGRFTTYFGANRYYQTAPAKLTSGSTGPLVIFKENIPENMDSLLIQHPQVNSLNAAIVLRYQVTTRLQLGFSIDLIGFSLGAETKTTYINGVQGGIEMAKPTSFNVLLISDNDRGSLNSEFYVIYSLKNNWGIKTAAQFHFTEYTTNTEVQQFPEPNDRFRNKSLLVALGVAKKF